MSWSYQAEYQYHPVWQYMPTLTWESQLIYKQVWNPSLYPWEYQCPARQENQYLARPGQPMATPPYPVTNPYVPAHQPYMGAAMYI